MPASPSPSAEVSSTFGAAISKPRVSVFTERPPADTIARSTYLPGGIWCTGIVREKITRVSPAGRGGTSTLTSAGASAAVAICTPS